MMKKLRKQRDEMLNRLLLLMPLAALPTRFAWARDIRCRRNIELMRMPRSWRRG